MYIHIAWLYPAVLVGCLFGMVVMGLCAAADTDKQLGGSCDSTKRH